MSKITVVLLDLDGVVRHFDDDLLKRVERTHELVAGQLTDAAFGHERFGLVSTGKLPREQWVVEIGEHVGCPEAAAEWLADTGIPDPRMLEVAAELRRRSITVAVLTNGTDGLDTELRQLDLVDRFDVIFNTADIGYAKPDERAFAHVCDQLGVAPSAVFFTDDSPPNVDAANAIGMTAHHFDGVDGFMEKLSESGIDLSL